MVAIDLVSKIRLFPFRRRAGAVVAGFSLMTFLHLVVRWLSCPFELLDEYVPARGTVYDLGCGHGLFLHYLFSVRPVQTVFWGLDVDRRKIMFAQAFNKSPQLRFEVKDITADLDPGAAAGIILNDVLHLLPFVAQEKLLRRCFCHLEPDGVLIIKEINRVGSWKYRWTKTQEFLVNRVFRWTMGNEFNCHSADAMRALLSGIGFQVKTLPADKGYPYAHVIYICHKG